MAEFDIFSGLRNLSKQNRWFSLGSEPRTVKNVLRTYYKNYFLCHAHVRIASTQGDIPVHRWPATWAQHTRVRRSRFSGRRDPCAKKTGKWAVSSDGCKSVISLTSENEYVSDLAALDSQEGSKGVPFFFGLIKTKPPFPNVGFFTNDKR